MKLNELNRKLKQNAQDYNKKVSEIDNKSRAREQKKIEELYGNAINNIQKPSISTQNETIPEVKEESEELKELKSLYKQWYFLTKSFPKYKSIWINNFPKWFVDYMQELGK